MGAGRERAQAAGKAGRRKRQRAAKKKRKRTAWRCGLDNAFAPAYFCCACYFALSAFYYKNMLAILRPTATTAAYHHALPRFKRLPPPPLSSPFSLPRAGMAWLCCTPSISASPQTAAILTFFPTCSACHLPTFQLFPFLLPPACCFLPGVFNLSLLLLHLTHATGMLLAAFALA